MNTNLQSIEHQPLLNHRTVIAICSRAETSAGMYAPCNRKRQQPRSRLMKLASLAQLQSSTIKAINRAFST